MQLDKGRTEFIQLQALRYYLTEDSSRTKMNLGSTDRQV